MLDEVVLRQHVGHGVSVARIDGGNRMLAECRKCRLPLATFEDPEAGRDDGDDDSWDIYNTGDNGLGIGAYEVQRDDTMAAFSCDEDAARSHFFGVWVDEDGHVIAYGPRTPEALMKAAYHDREVDGEGSRT